MVILICCLFELTLSQALKVKIIITYLSNNMLISNNSHLKSNKHLDKEQLLKGVNQSWVYIHKQKEMNHYKCLHMKYKSVFIALNFIHQREHPEQKCIFQYFFFFFVVQSSAFSSPKEPLKSLYRQKTKIILKCKEVLLLFGVCGFP